MAAGDSAARASAVLFFQAFQAMKKRIAASVKKATLGMPGTRPTTARIAAAMVSARYWPNTWPIMAWAMSCEREARVTSMATAEDTSSAGSWATRPSPMESRV
ncbi:hypothetical protein D3C71_1724250 [compost metagenome]